MPRGGRVLDLSTDAITLDCKAETGERRERQGALPGGEERGGEEDEEGDGVGVDEEDVVAHPAGGGGLEEGLESNVQAFHGSHCQEWQRLPVTTTGISPAA